MEQSSYPGLPGIIHSSLPELRRIHGIGVVKAVQLKCIGELSKRIASEAARSMLILKIRIRSLRIIWNSFAIRSRK